MTLVDRAFRAIRIEMEMMADWHQRPCTTVPECRWLRELAACGMVWTMTHHKGPLG